MTLYEKIEGEIKFLECSEKSKLTFEQGIERYV